METPAKQAPIACGRNASCSSPEFRCKIFQVEEKAEQLEKELEQRAVIESILLTQNESG